MHDVAKPLRREAKVKSTRKMVIKALLAVGALVLVICGIKAMQIVTMVTTKPPMPVATVTSAPVKEEDWAPMLSAVGAVSAVQGAMVSTELAGTVSEIMFQNGGVAKKGDVILKLDASQEEALLRSAEAEAELARTDLERTRGLASQNVVSKAELDAAESKFRRLTAVVDQMRSNIRKKTIVAPFDGELGIRQVNVGQMINAGQQVVLLQSLDPVYVDFALPQQHLQNLSTGLEARVRTDALPGREFVGKLTAINSGNVHQDRHCIAGETQVARYSGVGDFVRALRRFRFRNRETKG